MSNEELLSFDEADPRTKRGGKFERDRNSARSQAKVWVIFFFLCTIFWVSLRVSDNTPSPECTKTGACDCLNLFDAVYTADVLFMFFYMAFRIKIGCNSSRSTVTRRSLKN